MPKEKIEPNIILTLTTNNSYNIPIIITDIEGNTLLATHITRTGDTYYEIRKKLRLKLEEIFKAYAIDTILLEQNQLFIDKIDRYPDPYVLRNIQLGFSIKTMIEDIYWEQVKYIFEIPRWEWKKEVLNKKVEYAIDLYKSHILLGHNLSKENLELYDCNNYYEALCFSESLQYSKFLNKKYVINMT